MFPADLVEEATQLLDRLRNHGLTLVTAESCTGGLVSALLTEVPGSSEVLERGYVTYSNAAKSACLGVAPALLAQHGAVSAEVARAMAQGALTYSLADLSVAVTGVAGPGGGSAHKPVGLVHVAVARHGGRVLHKEHRLGETIGRAAIRLASVRAALALIAAALDAAP